MKLEDRNAVAQLSCRFDLNELTSSAFYSNWRDNEKDNYKTCNLP